MNVHYIKATYPNGDVIHYELREDIEQIVYEDEIDEATVYYTDGSVEVVNLYNMLSYQFKPIE